MFQHVVTFILWSSYYYTKAGFYTKFGDIFVKYSHKEKSELIITKKKIEYEGELSNYYNEKLKRRTRHCRKDSFIREYKIKV